MKEIIDELAKLTDSDRRAVLENLLACTRQEQESHLNESPVAYRTVDLQARGVDELHAADLLARLKTFTEDWNRPEAAIYDENPAR